MQKSTFSCESFWKVLIKVSDVENTALSSGSVINEVVKVRKFQEIVASGEL